MPNWGFGWWVIQPVWGHGDDAGWLPSVPSRPKQLPAGGPHIGTTGCPGESRIVPDFLVVQPYAMPSLTPVNTLPPQLKRSLTWDQGTEMAAHHGFSIATNVVVKFPRDAGHSMLTLRGRVLSRVAVGSPTG